MPGIEPAYVKVLFSAVAEGSEVYYIQTQFQEDQETGLPVSGGGGEGRLDIYNLMLQTFKFTDEGTEEVSSNTYRVEISLKPGAAQPNLDKEEFYFLVAYLQEVLGLPESDKVTDVISKIAYDVREGTPYDDIYNFNYYLVLSQGRLDSGKVYEDSYTEIKVESVSTRVAALAADPKYCQTDADCVVRANFCIYGSFNNYHPYNDVWGCGAPEDETGYTFATYDESMGCSTKVEYGGSKCVANKCVGQDRTVTCENL